VSLLGCPQFRRIFSHYIEVLGRKFDLCSPIQCESGVHAIDQKKTLWASTKCGCQVEHVTHDLGGMEDEVGFIALSQELTNCFSLNLELRKFMSRSLNIL